MSDSPKFMDKLLDDVADKVTDGSGGNTKSSQIIKTEAVNEDISHKSSEDAYFTPLNALAVAALYMEPYEEVCGRILRSTFSCGLLLCSLLQ